MKKIYQIVLLCAILLLALCSCSNNEKEKVYNQEGGTKAFYSNISDIQKNISGKTITYGTKDCSSNYRTAMTDATKALTATSSKLTFKTDTTKNTGSYYAGEYNGNTTPYYTLGTKEFTKKSGASSTNVSGANAFNCYNTNHSTSMIFFNRYSMDDYSASARKMLAMHELGHTIGFKDFYSGSYVYDNDASVMKGVYSSGMTVFSDYTEFDKQCIQDVYGK